MKVHVRLFSVAKDLAGFDAKTVELQFPATAQTIVDHLAADNPAFIKWKPSLRLAVNLEYVNPNHPLTDGDEVAVIPPVSGG